VFGQGFPESGVVISEIESSYYYMVSSVFGFETKLGLCTYCRSLRSQDLISLGEAQEPNGQFIFGTDLGALTYDH
jgi:hypothetical protein